MRWNEDGSQQGWDGRCRPAALERASTARGLGLSSLMPVLMMSAALMPVAAQAQSQDSAQAPTESAAQTAAQNSRAFDIPAQSLAAALGLFGQQGGQQILFDEALVAGRQSAAVQGRYAPREALERLLAGTGLIIARSEAGGFVLGADPAARAAGSRVAALPAVTVRAAAERDGTTQGSESYTALGPSAAATGLGLSLRETPQSVSVITRQQIEDFNLNSLTDVARATPGVFVRNDGIAEDEGSPVARGFGFDRLSVDGVAMSLSDHNGRSVAADMVMFDRVEVIRGATGLLQGSGQPSGTINLVRKRPTAEPLLEATASVGSWNLRQLSVDGGGALNATGSVRGRIAGTARDGDSFVDVTGTKNGLLYAIVEVDLGARSTLGIGASAQRTRVDGTYRGLPTFPDGSDMRLPRSTYLDTPDSFLKRDTDTVFLDFAQRLGGGWQWRASYNHLEASSDSRYSVRQRIEGNPWQLENSESGWRYRTRQNLFDLRLTGTFDAFGRAHDVVVGASHRDDEVDWRQTWQGGSGLVDIATWNPGAHRLNGEPADDPLAQQRRVKESGLYATTRLRLSEPLSVLLGGRLAWFTEDWTGGWYTGEAQWERARTEKGEFTPYIGIVHDLGQQLSVYGSISQIFRPQSANDVNGRTLDPVTGTNYELGIKGSFRDGRVDASAAVYRIDEKNRAVRDDANCPTTGAISCSRAAGEVQSEGVELTVSGAVTPAWQVSAGYAYVRARYIRDQIAANIGQPVTTDEPHHLFKFFSSYRLPGDWQRWRLQGSVLAQSRVYRAEPGFRTEQGPVVLVGLGSSYRIDRHWNVQFNIDNLFDRRWYQEMGNSWAGYGVRYGAPRSAMLSLRYRL